MLLSWFRHMARCTNSFIIFSYNGSSLTASNLPNGSFQIHAFRHHCWNHICGKNGNNIMIYFVVERITFINLRIILTANGLPSFIEKWAQSAEKLCFIIALILIINIRENIKSPDKTAQKVYNMIDKFSLVYVLSSLHIQSWDIFKAEIIIQWHYTLTLNCITI